MGVRHEEHQETAVAAAEPANNDDGISVSTEITLSDSNSPGGGGKIVIDLNERSHQDAVVLPPPKWKFFCILFPLIFLITWLEDLSGVVPYVMGVTGFRLNFMVFCIMFVNIYVFVYSTLSFVPWLLNVTIKGQTYGLSWWLKRPRLGPKLTASTCPPVSLLGCFLEILEDGFQLFDMGWYEMAEEEHKDLEEIDKDGSHFMKFHNTQDKNDYRDGKTESKIVEVHYEYVVDPEKLEEFNELCVQTDSVLRAMGAISIVHGEQKHILPDTYGDADDDDEEKRIAIDDRRRMLKRMSFQNFLGGVHHRIKTEFRNVDSLNRWLASGEREKCMKRIKPLLMKPHEMKLQDERALPDIFTDLLVPQGSGAPDLPPKKWKVANVTIAGFWLTFILQNPWWADYSVIWFPDETPVDMASGQAPGMLALNLAILVASFMYFTEPFLMYLFAPWLCRKRNENDTQEPWRTLNDGFRSMWIQAFITLAFFFLWFGLYAGYDWSGIPPP